MKELRALTGLRGIAAMTVLCYHVRSEMPPPGEGWPEVFKYGYLGVDLFFLLSGFVLAYVYRDYRFHGDGGLVRYLGLRLARIYPAHVVVLFGFGVFAFASGYAQVHAERFTIAELFTHLTLTSAWGVHQSNSWNIPAWSISAEMFAYFNLPLLFMLYLRLKHTLGGQGAALGLLTAGYALLFIVPALNNGSIGSSTILALIRVIAEFTMGFAAYMLSRGRAPGGGFWPVLLILAGLAVILVLAFELPDILSVPLFLAVITALAWGGGWIARLFGHPVLHFLGRISYSLYLIHYPVLVAFHLAVYRLQPPPLLWTALAIVTCLVLAAVLNRLIEEPARQWVRARLPESSD